MTRHWRVMYFRCAAVLATAVATAGMITACGSGSGSGSGSTSAGGASGTVAAYYASSPFTADFNPLSPGTSPLALGMVYEPLMFFDTAQAGQVHPWLATGYAWGAGGTSITFALRHGVSWSDGKPFTSADVAYTFNFEKNPTFNSYGLPIAGATANGPYSVTITFTRPVYTDLIYIAGHTLIIPEHIWATVKNPATWLDSKPVGTGAYLVQKVNPQLIELTANPHYYIAGLPKVKTYEFEYFSGNQTVDSAIESGQLAWAAAYIPNAKQLYADKNPKYALTDIPLAVQVLIPNMVKGPTASLAVRQAISAALDRNYMNQSIYNGYNQPINPEGLLMPNFRSVASPATLSDSFGGADPAAAKRILEAAGYKLGPDGMFKTPSGQPLTINVQVVDGWTDSDTITQVAQQELKAAGINLTITQEATSVYSTNQYSGNFQLISGSYGYTPSPYQYYYTMLDSAVAKPLGTTESVGNFGRFANPAVDSLLNNIAATTSTAVQNRDFYKIEELFKQQIPDIPLFSAEDEIEFNGNMVSGYPTGANPFAGTPAWLSPDNGWVAARMAPAK